MSPRNFVRLFTRETGRSPGKFVEHVQLDRARTLLSDTLHSPAVVADLSGFGNIERMRRTFQRNLAISPENFRRRFPNLAVRFDVPRGCAC